MAVLLLVRHALTDATGKRLSGHTPGIHLSTEGRRQAEELAARLAPLPLAAVYSSPLERCIETAEVAVGSRGLTVQRVSDLIEVGYGRWTGRPFGQLVRTALWKRIQSSPSSVRFPDGETLVDVQRRGVLAAQSIAERHGRKIVAAFSHADVIRLILAHFLGVHVDLFQRIIVNPTSVSAVMLGDRVPRILRMNDTGGLTDLVARTAPRGRSAGRSAVARGRSAGGPASPGAT